MILSKTTILVAIAAFVVVVIVISHLASLYVDYKIDIERQEIESSRISAEELSNQHGKIVHVDGNHYRVIASRNKLSDAKESIAGCEPSLIGFCNALGFLSDYYGQSIRMLKQGNPLAFVFFARALKWQGVAKSNLKGEKMRAAAASLTINEVEVLHAPDFALATVPLIGYFYQYVAVEEHQKALEYSWANAHHLTLGHALLASKLWALTGDIHYKYVVGRVPISKASDQNTVARIARHLEMKDNEELYAHCKWAK